VKRVVVAAVVIGFGLLIAYPVLIGKPPLGDRPAMRDYAAKTRVYLGALGVCLLVSGVASLLVVRQAKAEYRETAKSALREMAEGTREDLLRRQRQRDGDA
jgi:predicted phage tail protein